MSDQKLIFKEPVMSGEYVWRGKGIKLVNNIFKVFTEELSAGGDVAILRCGNFVRKGFYLNLYHQISDYKNIFMCTDRDFIVRPEVTYDLCHFLQKNNKKSTFAVTNTTLYRQFKAKAFLIDQRLWPAISFCIFSEKSETSEQLKNLTALINSFYDRFLLPRIWVERSGGFKKFADAMLLPLMPENKNSLTVLSTLYVLSEQFSTALNINSLHIIEFGFSERIIATYCGFQENKGFIIWPSAISTNQVIVCDSSRAEFTDYLNSQDIRFRCYDFRPHLFKTEQDILKKEEIRQGAPLVIFPYNNQNYYCLPANMDIGLLTNKESIAPLLQKSDNLIFAANREYFKKCLSKTDNVFVCDRCLDKEDYLTSVGAIYPNHSSTCQKCNSASGLKQILVPAHTKQTISEKLNKT